MHKLKIDFKSGINEVNDFIALLSDTLKVKPLDLALYMKNILLDMA